MDVVARAIETRSLTYRFCTKRGTKIIIIIHCCKLFAMMMTTPFALLLLLLFVVVATTTTRVSAYDLPVRMQKTKAAGSDGFSAVCHTPREMLYFSHPEDQSTMVILSLDTRRHEWTSMDWKEPGVGVIYCFTDTSESWSYVYFVTTKHELYRYRSAGNYDTSASANAVFEIVQQPGGAVGYHNHTADMAYQAFTDNGMVHVFARDQLVYKHQYSVEVTGDVWSVDQREHFLIFGMANEGVIFFDSINYSMRRVVDRVCETKTCFQTFMVKAYDYGYGDLSVVLWASQRAIGVMTVDLRKEVHDDLFLIESSASFLGNDTMFEGGCFTPEHAGVSAFVMADGFLSQYKWAGPGDQGVQWMANITDFQLWGSKWVGTPIVGSPSNAHACSVAKSDQFDWVVAFGYLDEVAYQDQARAVYASPTNMN